MAARISFILLILVSFYSDVLAQKPVLNRKINYSAKSERLEDILLDIADLGGFSFSYNPDLLPVDSLMTISIENSTIKDVLKALLGDELELKISGNHLVILKSKFSSGNISGNAAGKSYTIDGYVRNQSTGYAVYNAMVFDVSRLSSTVSDSSGYFSLEVSSRESMVGIAVIKKDYLDTTLVLLNGNQNLEVNISRKPGNVEVSNKEGYTLAGVSGVNNRKIVRMVTPQSNIEQSGNLDIYAYKFGQVSFLPFLGTNLKMSGMTENKVSLNILAGYNGATNGVEIGGLFNINRHYAKGVQIAGLGNIVGEETVGLQISGLFNTNLGNVTGVQFAGINNMVLDTLRGFQISGINNFASHDVDGF